MSRKLTSRISANLCQCRSFLMPSKALYYPRIRPNARLDVRKPDVISKGEPVALPECTILSRVVTGPQTEENGAPFSESNNVPWYLRANESITSSLSLPKRVIAPIPDIPLESPDLLQPLLDHMARDLGLTDLTLLDLRNSENPWGDNTIMLLTTAISERQLKSAVEGLKGWLRERHIRPRVEGLIKWEDTKVKRRRRRKQATRPNYQMEDDRLKWVFVDVGGNTGLILQMFTEDGRNEYDLEELWSKRAVSVSSPRQAQPTPTFTDIASVTPGQIAASGPLNRRSYSTLARQMSTVCFQQETIQATHASESFPLPTSLATAIRDKDWPTAGTRLVPLMPEHMSDLQDVIRKILQELTLAGEFEKVLGLARYYRGSDEKGLDGTAFAMRAHVNHFAKNATGRYQFDTLFGIENQSRSSLTRFEQSFFSCLPSSPSLIHYRIMLEWYVQAAKYVPWKYTVEKQLDVLHRIHEAKLKAPSSFYFTIMNNAAVNPANRDTQGETSGQAILEAKSSERLNVIVRVSDLMRAHGKSVAEPDIYRAMYTACLAVPPDVNDMILNVQAGRIPRRQFDKRALAIEDTMIRLGVPLSLSFFHIILCNLATAHQWTAFWVRWKDLALAGFRRNENEWAMMFALLANVGNKKECVIALAHSWNEMAMESPPIKMTRDLIRAVEVVLSIADPDGSGYERIRASMRRGSEILPKPTG